MADQASARTIHAVLTIKPFNLKILHIRIKDAGNSYSMKQFTAFSQNKEENLLSSTGFWFSTTEKWRVYRKFNLSTGLLKGKSAQFSIICHQHVVVTVTSLLKCLS